jgi:hypothetical protein
VAIALVASASFAEDKSNSSNESHGCKLYFVAAMTVAYYNNPVRDVGEVDWVPIPGASLACGNIRTNIMLVPSASRVPLAVAIASMSVVF